MRTKLEGTVYYNSIVNMLKVHLCPSHIEKVLRLPDAVSSDVLNNASVQITLTVSGSGRY